MSHFFKNVITKRSLLGTLFLVILIGEPTVGMATGIFTPPGIVVFFFLYNTLFHLFESIIAKYKLVVWQVILLTFAIYSVLVTGLLHKEVTEFAAQPVITPLIRIQASFFVAFAFYLLNKIFPRNNQAVLSITASSIYFAIFVGVLSITGQWGLPLVIIAFKTVPMLSIGFSIAAVIATFFALQSKPIPTIYKGTVLLWITYFYLIVGAIPSLVTFMILLITMIFGGIYLMFNKTIRNQLL